MNRPRLKDGSQPIGAVGLLMLLTACTPQAHSPEPTAPRHTSTLTSDAVRINERLRTAPRRRDDVDSLAVWHDSGGSWLIASAKDTNRLLIYDAASGRLLRSVGTAGDTGGHFRRPNGVAVVDDLLLVCERDNARVQVLRLPDLTPLGWIGAGSLRRPYGLAAYRTPQPDDDSSSAQLPPAYELYVTDNYQGNNESVPPADQLGARVKHFRFRVTALAGTASGGDRVAATLIRSFGATSGAGVLHSVESIQVDPLHGHLLIADEYPSCLDIKIYSLDGEFTGTLLGHATAGHRFGGHPEGIALYACGDQGLWITVDQREDGSLFHLWDRNTLAYSGSFMGQHTADTDGVAVTQEPFGEFEAGAFFAVHADQSVSTFDLRDLHQASLLPPC